MWHCVAINLLWVRCVFTHTYNKHSNIKCTMGEWMDGYPGDTWLTHKFVEELLNSTTAPFSQPTSQQANNPHKPASNAINTIGINSLSKPPSSSPHPLSTTTCLSWAYGTVGGLTRLFLFVIFIINFLIQLNFIQLKQTKLKWEFLK